MKAKIFALVALVLGMVSCQKEINGIAVDKNGEAAVTISVALPEEGATRAGGADSAVGAIGNIDLAQYDIRYILEVYDENGGLAKRIEQFEAESTQTSFALRLVPGRHYRFVVWADFVTEGSEVALHYNAEDLTCVSLINGSESNYSPMDESRDAYTGVYDTDEDGGKVFDSSSNIAITLTRPFAKLRVVTTDMKEIYSDLVSATVNYTSPLYNTFDALNATAKGVDTNVTKVVDFSTMTYTNEPTEDGKQTLFADYLFGTEDGTVQFTLDVEDAVAAIPQVIFNTNIPVQRNYLTTVTGPILTDSNNITVTIEEGFAGYHDVFVKVASAEELADAIENAEDGVETVIEITDDIDITDLFAGLLSTRANTFDAAITIPASKNICLNIADKNVTYSSDYMNGAMIQNNGKLTIKGTTGSLIYTYEGEADTTNTYGNYAISNAGELNIDANISIVASKAVEGQKFSHALYVVNNGNGGKVNFDGGLVYNAFGYAVREFGDGDLTVNGGEIKGTRAIWLQLPSSETSLAPAINLTVNGGKLTSTGESGGYQLAVYSYNYGSKLNNVNIVVNGGEFDGDIALTGGTNKAEVENVTIYGGHIRNIYSYGNEAAAKESIVIYGGSFENDPSAFIAPKHFVTEENGAWIVKPYTNGSIITINGVKAVVYEKENGIKAVSVEELNLNGKNYSDAAAWAEGLGNGWHLASIYELDKIWEVRKDLNKALMADNTENALFEEDDYYTEGKYAMYLSSTMAMGTDPQGVDYFANRAHLKYFNLNGYWDYPYSSYSTINVSAPLKANHFARAVYTLEYGIGDIVEANGVKGVVYGESNDAYKVVSVAQGDRMSWYEANDWAEELGEGWSLASLEDMQAIHRVRAALNDVLAVDNSNNALFLEVDKEEDGSYADYWTSTIVEGTENAMAPKAYYIRFNTAGTVYNNVWVTTGVEYSRAVYTLAK